jgi:hypothetical protein
MAAGAETSLESAAADAAAAIPRDYNFADDIVRRRYQKAGQLHRPAYIDARSFMGTSEAASSSLPLRWTV